MDITTNDDNFHQVKLYQNLLLKVMAQRKKSNHVLEI